MDPIDYTDDELLAACLQFLRRAVVFKQRTETLTTAGNVAALTEEVRAFTPEVHRGRLLLAEAQARLALGLDPELVAQFAALLE